MRPSSRVPRCHEAKLNLIFDAIKGWDGAEADAYDPKVNPQLKEAVREAKKVAIPETYVKRVLDYAKQGHTAIEFPTYDTDWDSEAYNSVSGPELQQLHPCDGRLSEGR